MLESNMHYIAANINIVNYPYTPLSTPDDALHNITHQLDKRKQRRVLKLYDAVACLHSSLFPYTAGSIIRYKELKDNNYIRQLRAT